MESQDRFGHLLGYQVSINYCPFCVDDGTAKPAVATLTKKGESAVVGLCEQHLSEYSIYLATYQIANE